MTKAVNSLLKGCYQHFHTGITRLKRIGGVVQPQLQDTFESHALGLLEAINAEAFKAHAAALIHDFPGVKNWMDWWQQDRPSRMLFKPFRTMKEDLWKQLPDTTNAEEAMHFRLYSGLGRNLGLMEGLEGLFSFVNLLEMQGIAKQSGIPVAYGTMKPWTKNAHRLG